ncbi:MAG: heavy-metal-associated domain-containing protein [Acholeplasmataceae bacterium]|nr:heavy-metal-associated domain-containing protein [Acholeplasmataceae bacterium]
MKIKVPDMTCNNCVIKIEKALLMGGLKATVELQDQSVSFKNDMDLEKIKDIIAKIGYTPRI